MTTVSQCAVFSQRKEITVPWDLLYATFPPALSSPALGWKSKGKEKEKERCDQNIPPLDCMPPPPARILSSPAGQCLTRRGWSRGAGVQILQSSSHAPDTAASRPALVLVGVSVLLPLSPSDTTMVPGLDGKETRWSPDGPTAAVSPHAYLWCSRTAPTTLP